MNANAFDDFCRTAIDFLDSANVPYLAIGGLAVAVVGEPRLTGDVDVVAFVSMDAAERVIPLAAAAGFTAAEDEVDRLRATGTLRFRRDRFLPYVHAGVDGDRPARADILPVL